jgi:hypothetical protein
VISGAIIASVVERAKGIAIKADRERPDEGISEAVQVAFNAEYGTKSRPRLT